jgi:hypothetical protein
MYLPYLRSSVRFAILVVQATRKERHSSDGDSSGSVRGARETAVGCASAGSDDLASDPASSPTPVPRLDCASASGRPELTDSRRLDVVRGSVRFVSVRVVARQPRRWIRPNASGDFMRKIPLIVARGADVRIEVLQADREHVSLGYTRSAKHGAALNHERPGKHRVQVADGDPVLDFQACDEPAGSWWSGGVYVDGPRCVRLALIEGTTREVVRLPFGKGTCATRSARN